jgi:hypothetical protein
MLPSAVAGWFQDKAVSHLILADQSHVDCDSRLPCMNIQQHQYLSLPSGSISVGIVKDITTHLK